MLARELKGFGGAALFAVAGSAAAAEGCDVEVSGFDLSAAEAQAVYGCLAEALQRGYAQGDTRWIPAEYVRDYRSWTLASTHPAAPGFHSNRFLLTWVNDIGAEAYMRYAEDPQIPAGTVIAKESFSVGESGNVAAGPLFLMEKAAEGAAPETDDWYYMAVAPSGAPMALNVVSACHECHSGFDFQGNLGYPVGEARVR